MRIHQVQNTQRIYDDIRIAKIETALEEQELLTEELLGINEEVHLFEIIASAPCQLVFTFANGKTSRVKTIQPNRVVTFENLRPIKSARLMSQTGTMVDVAIAV